MMHLLCNDVNDLIIHLILSQVNIVYSSCFENLNFIAAVRHQNQLYHMPCFCEKDKNKQKTSVLIRLRCQLIGFNLMLKHILIMLFILPVD